MLYSNKPKASTNLNPNRGFKTSIALAPVRLKHKQSIMLQ